MATASTIYTTADGKTFTDVSAANAHEALLANAKRIDDFLDIHYPKPAEGAKATSTRGIAKKAIALWLGNSEQPAQASADQA